MDIKQILMTWKSFFSQSNIFYDLFIWIGWGLATALKTLVDAAEDVLDAVYGILSFTEWGPVKNFFSRTELRVLLIILLAAVLVACGVLLMFKKEGERPKLVKNVVFAVSIMILLPFAITTLNKLTIYSRELIGGGDASTSERILASCIVDLKYIDNTNKFTVYTVSGSAVSGGPTNSFSSTPENATYIDPTEKITKDTDLNYPDLFTSRLQTDESGNLVVEEIDEMVIPLLNWDFTSWYYRYNIDFFTLYISMIATCLAVFFTAFKTGRLIFEIAIHNTILPLVAIADANNGQRMKRVVQGIVNTYCVFFFTMLLIKFFFLGQEYLTSHVSNSLLRGLLLIPFAAAVIDGPNIFERILDIDVGLSSSVKSIMAIGAAARTAKGVASAPGRLLGRVNASRHAHQDRKMNRERLQMERDAAKDKKDYYASQKAQAGGGSSVDNSRVNVNSTNSATINNQQPGVLPTDKAASAAETAAVGTAAASDSPSERDEDKRSSFEGINNTAPANVTDADMLSANSDLTERQRILLQADLDNQPDKKPGANRGYWAERPRPEKGVAKPAQASPGSPSIPKAGPARESVIPTQTTQSAQQAQPAAPKPSQPAPPAPPAPSPAAPVTEKAAFAPQPEPEKPENKTGKRDDEK